MYRSYSVSNMPKPIDYIPEKRQEHKSEPPRREPPKPRPRPKEKGIGNLLENLQSDDIILLIVILILLMDDCEDKMLLAALGFIFFSDMF